MAYDSDISTKSRDLIVLERARERIARFGWRQRYGIRKAPDDGYCLLVACGDVQLKKFVNYPGLGRFAVLLGFDGWQGAVEWNDAPGRTQAEVLARFDSAIAKLLASQG